MASPASAKKQIIDSIKDKKSVLVTVSKNPSVDELAAALGLTIFLNKLEKHATAIVSGEIPSTLEFLDPEKTFEATTDSLRDFIISLDKEKADHLRFKPDGDVVKIFITPYKTTITSEDLDFSQGDYNVELVIALNVASSDDLDEALSAHGRILHDAVVSTISAGGVKSNLGTIDWRDQKVSGVSEMVAEIISELKTTKVEIDEQIATALLTGIVASTKRFSNDLTSPRVMTVAAELMAAGANQQLIATKLTEVQPVETTETQPIQPVEDEVAEVTNDEPAVVEEAVGGEEFSNDDSKLRVDRSQNEEQSQPEEIMADDSSIEDDRASERGDVVMSVDHPREDSLDDTAERVLTESRADAAKEAEEQLSTLTEVNQIVPGGNIVNDEASDMERPASPSTPSLNDELEQVTEQINAATDASGPVTVAAPTPAVFGVQPVIGGTLNATTDAAAEAKRTEILRDQNRTILSHGTPMAEQLPSTQAAPMNASMADQADQPTVTDIFSAPPMSPMATSDPAAANAAAGSPQAMALSSAPAMSEQEAALNAVNTAIAMPTAPPSVMSAGPSNGFGQSNGLPPLPDFNSLPPLPPAPAGVNPNGLPSLPSLPPLPSNDNPANFNPSQFQIPPQN